MYFFYEDGGKLYFFTTKFERVSLKLLSTAVKLGSFKICAYSLI